MSAATTVPETVEMTGYSAFHTLRRTNVAVLLRDGFARLRVADGFSHSRAMAFQLVLALVPGTIVLVAIASELRWESLSNAVIHTTESLAPGPTADVFRDAFGQADDAGQGRSGWPFLTVGGTALLIAGTTAFGQFERASNRIYGVEVDRPAAQKYTLAAKLMITAGTLSVLYFLTIGLGAAWTTHDSAWWQWWAIGRWPLALVLLSGALAILFRVSPRRRQPSVSWLAFGAVLGVVGSLVVSALLALYLTASSGFGDTYGPLAGFMGVLLWAYGSSIAVFYGIAVAAQLEAVRAGVAEPRDDTKIRNADPDMVVVPYGTAALRPES